MAREVPEALAVAHRMFWGVVITALVAAALCFPYRSDAPRLAELRLLDGLTESLDPAAIERALLNDAQARATSSLTSVAAAVEGKGVRDLEAAEGHAQLFRVGPPRLSNLGELHAAGHGGVELRAEGPHMGLLARGLRWRLARKGGAANRALTGLRLSERTASAAQLEAEAEVETLRLGHIRARRAYAKARRRFLRLRARSDALRARSASRSTRRSVQEKRHEAYLAMEEAKLQSETAHALYDQAVASALSEGPEARDSLPSGVVVVATFTSGNRVLEETVPVPQVTRSLPTTPVPLPAALRKLAEAERWSQRKSQTLEQARADVASEVSWHARMLRLGGWSVRGASLLALLPLCLWLQLAWLSRSCRAVRDAFSPFRHPGAELPRVGTRIAWLDATLLIGLPALAVAMASLTLYRVGGPTWLALALGLPCVAYAVRVVGQWEQLGELRATIIQSNRPPPLAVRTGQEAV